MRQVLRTGKGPLFRLRVGARGPHHIECDEGMIDDSTTTFRGRSGAYFGRKRAARGIPRTAFPDQKIGQLLGGLGSSAVRRND